MSNNTGMYRELKEALKDQIQSYLVSQKELIDVHAVPYQNIGVFPAVALEIVGRRKPKKGVGVRQLELDMVVWVYVDIMDAEDAEMECLRLTEIVENAIESDKTLGGQAMYLDIDDNAEFGTVQQGKATFLQGAKLQVKIKKRFV
jgi:hypothetical protein